MKKLKVSKTLNTSASELTIRPDHNRIKSKQKCTFSQAPQLTTMGTDHSNVEAKQD